MSSPPPHLTEVAVRVEAELGRILDTERAVWLELDPCLDEPLLDLAELVLGPGKRIRPAYCHWGWVLAGGDPGDDDATLGAGCALELLHAFALVHDDVMDGSPTRRGSPTVWARFVERHHDRAWHGEDRRFGEASAILVGDMAMVMADRALGDVDPEVRAIWNTLRTELNMGQYLDVVGTVSGDISAASARTIVRHKTAGYTIVRPLQLGAALAGRPDLDESLAAHGVPLGTAFQLRDDVLGAFGDPARTGKPVGDDLREGKPTVMLALARAAADPSQCAVLERVGSSVDDADVDAIQQVMVETGALAAIEQEIRDLYDESIRAIETLPDLAAGREALRAMADFVVGRDV